MKKQLVKFKKNFDWFSLSIGILLVSFVFLAEFAKKYTYFWIDLQITHYIQEIPFIWFGQLMQIISSMGEVINGGLLLLLGVVLLFQLNQRKDSLILVLSTVGAVVISWIFKFIVARPRPDPMIIHQLKTYHSPDSFPSGHVLFFVGFWGFLLYLAILLLPSGWTKKIWIILLVLIIFSMGLSRIYVGAHWFSDTLGAYIVGAIWLLLIVKLRHVLFDFRSNKSQ